MNVSEPIMMRSGEDSSSKRMRCGKLSTMQQPPARKSKSKHGCQHDEDDSSRSSPVQQVYKPIRGHRPPPYITVAAGFLILARQRVSEASTSPRLIKSASDRNMLPPFLNITYRESSWSRADESCERRFLNCGQLYRDQNWIPSALGELFGTNLVERLSVT